MAVKIVHCIFGLAAGGAEYTLLKLVSAMDANEFTNVIINFLGKGDLSKNFRAAGVKVYNLNMKRGSVPTPAILYRLVKIIRTEEPVCIQGWMYNGNIAALLAKYLSFSSAVLLWNVRHSIYDLKVERRATRFLITLGALISYLASKIIYNAADSAAQHEAVGFKKELSVVIPNGFEAGKFKPSKKIYNRFRYNTGILENTIIIGMVGRYHAHKGYHNLLNTCSIIHRYRPDIHFVFIGNNVDKDNIELVSLIRILDLEETTHLLGLRSDVEKILPAFDIFCLSSICEGFPNVIGEAMLSGVPCAVTNVGASKEIIEDCGKVLSPGDVQGMASGIIELLTMDKDALDIIKIKCRSRIISKYGMPQVVKKYETLYSSLAMN